MYNKKLEPILLDLESKEVELAGGSVVGMVLSITDSLIKYICNLTFNKKKYESVQSEIESIFNEANILKNKSLEVIDKDKEVLEKILSAYKTRNECPSDYEDACKESVVFCEEVLKYAFDSLKLSDDISKVGNKMLASDFKICKYYSYASVKAAIVNVNINLESISDEKFKKVVNKRVEKILKESDKYMKGL